MLEYITLKLLRFDFPRREYVSKMHLLVMLITLALMSFTIAVEFPLVQAPLNLSPTHTLSVASCAPPGCGGTCSTKCPPGHSFYMSGHSKKTCRLPRAQQLLRLRIFIQTKVCHSGGNDSILWSTETDRPL